MELKNNPILVIKGKDSFGTWRVAVGKDETQAVDCPLCGNKTQMLLAYTSGPNLPTGIQVESTILRRARQPIGITCGCWSRFTRQVIHVAEKGLAKGFPP